MSADPDRYLTPVEEPVGSVVHPTRAERLEHLAARQRFAAYAGYRIPSDRLGDCGGCGKKVTLVNVRAWPDMGFDVGECAHCGSTLRALQDGARSGA